MAKLSDLIIKIGADTKELNKSLGDSQRRIQATTGNIQKLGKQMSMAFTLPAAILGGTALQAYDKQANAIAQVEAGLRSTGNTAGYTSDQLQKMASDLQSKTIFGDEDILKNATAQLLTFTNISGEQFARTQKAALDLATRLDGDLKGASIQLGKALNDPIANLSALSRSGIQFSDEQKTVIKSLTETGRLAEAQTLILDELEKQYGGSAEAAAKAGMGGIKQLQNSFGDLQEEFGKVISEMLPPLVDFGKNVLASFSGMSDGMKKNIVIITGLVAAVGPMLVILPQLVAGFGMVKVAMLQGVIPAMQKMIAVMAANPILLVTAAVVGFGVHLNSLSKNADIAGRSIKVVQEAIKSSTVEAAKQSVVVDQLSKSVLDESKSEGERLKALQELQRMSPDYFAGLDLEKSKMGLLKQAVDSYKTSLLQAARVKGFQGALEEQAGTMAEMEIELQAMNEKYADAFAVIKQNNGIAASAALTYEDLAAAIAKGGMATQGISSGLIRQTNDYMAAKAAADRLTGAMEAVNNVPPPKTRLDDLRGQLDGLMSSFANTEKGTAAYEEIKAAIIETRNEIAALSPAVVVAGEQISEKFKTAGTEVKKAAEEVDDFAETFRRSLVEDLKNTPIELPVKPQLKLEQIDPIEEDTTEFDMDFQEDYDKFQKGQEMMREEWNKTAGMTQQFSEMFGSTIGNIVSGSQTAGQAMKSLALSVVKTLIGIAKAAVIANATQTATAAGPAALPMTPILIAGGLSLVEGLLGAIAFADGGIVSGPTLGLVGEYAGAKNNPEVIAPLDKLKSMIGDSGGGRVAVYGRLQGSDINISGERGKLKQNRTR